MGKNRWSRRSGAVGARVAWVAPILVALYAAVCLPAASAASPARRRPAIICPVLVGHARRPLCCGPPVAQPGQPSCCLIAQPGQPSCCRLYAAVRPAVRPICCPAVGTCAARVTIEARPDPSRAGRSVTVEGTVPGGDRVQVELWQRPVDRRAFTRVASATTSAAGGFIFTRPGAAVTRNTYWYVSCAGRRSATIEQLVRSAVMLRAARFRLRRGATLSLVGSVRPTRPGARIWLAERVGSGRWRVFARPLLLKGGRFAVSVRPRRAGRWRFRALVPSDAVNLEGDSKVLTVTVVR